MKKVTIGVVLFGEKYLKESLPSLINQDYPNIEFIFRDQEEDKYSGYELVKKELPEIFEKAKMEKGKNLWHSGGHNAIINQMTGDYYFCCSNDMLYPSDLVSNIVKEMEANPQFSIATCKLMRWDYKHKKKTNFIDSFGLGIKEHHHFYDIGQGEEDKGQYDEVKEVFGITGAFGVYSKKALESVRYQDEYFDQLIHYKNDVELSYRLRWAGQKALFIKDVKVYHDRQVDKKTKKALWVKQSSLKGEKILMEKNYSKKFPLKVRIKTRIYHFLKTTYLLLSTPKLIKELLSFRNIKGAIQKKKMAMKRNASPEEIVKLMH